MDRGSFFYSADGRLLVRQPGGRVRGAVESEWREAALAMNPALDNPAIAQHAPLYVSGLLNSPENR